MDNQAKKAVSKAMREKSEEAPTKSKKLPKWDILASKTMEG